MKKKTARKCKCLRHKAGNNKFAQNIPVKHSRGICIHNNIKQAAIIIATIRISDRITYMNRIEGLSLLL